MVEGNLASWQFEDKIHDLYETKWKGRDVYINNPAAPTGQQLHSPTKRLTVSDGPL